MANMDTNALFVSLVIENAWQGMPMRTQACIAIAL